MAVVRSPNYPQIDLGDALDVMKVAYKEEGKAKMSRAILAGHFGYSSLNGRALAKIGAVRAYGLIEGKEDDLRISSDAIDIFEAPEGSLDRAAALARCAAKPTIFQEIMSDFPTAPSEANLRFSLIKKGYQADAASKAARNYLSSVRLVQESGGSYDASETEVGTMDTVETQSRTGDQRGNLSFLKAGATAAKALQPLQQGMRQSVFPLEEGDVTLTFPADLSADGYAELKEYLDIFLRRAERARRREEDDVSDLI